MSLKIRCPKCARFYDIPPEHLGRRGRCKDCRSVFRMTSDLVVDEPAPTPQAVEPAPWVDSPCPSCGKVYQVPADRIGKKARCKACGAAFLVGTEPDEVVLDDGYSVEEPAPTAALRRMTGPAERPASRSEEGRAFSPAVRINSFKPPNTAKRASGPAAWGGSLDLASVRAIVLYVAVGIVVVGGVFAAYRSITMVARNASPNDPSNRDEPAFDPFPDQPPGQEPVRQSVMAQHEPLSRTALEAFEEMAVSARKLSDPRQAKAVLDEMAASYKKITDSEAASKKLPGLNPTEEAQLTLKYGPKMVDAMKRTRDAFVKLREQPVMGNRLDGPINDQSRGIAELEKEIETARNRVPCVDVVVREVVGDDAIDGVGIWVHRLADQVPPAVRQTSVRSFNGNYEGTFRVGPVADPQAYAKKLGTYEKINGRKIYLRAPRPSAEDIAAAKQKRADDDEKRRQEQLAEQQRRDKEKQERDEREVAELNEAIRKLGDNDVSIQSDGLRRIRGMNPIESKKREVEQRLLALLPKARDDQKGDIVEGLRRWGGGASFETLVALLPEVRGFDRRPVILDVIKKNDPKYIPTLTACFDEGSARNELLAFLKQHPAEADAGLKQALKHTKPDVRRGALEGLAELGGPDAVPLVEETITSDQDFLAREIAKRVLVQMRSRLKLSN